MTTKKQIPAPSPSKTTNSDRQSAYHRIDSLLHTMRCIAQYEDVLCELSQEIRRTGGLSPELTNEILSILEKLPSHDYLMDVDAVRDALEDVTPTSRTTSPRKVAKERRRKSSK
jgi:hypothetical protein